MIANGQNNESGKKCVLCNSILTDENRSREHIIPNAIGGRKKTVEFICNNCNNKFGKEWESDLAKQFLWFSHATEIKRERGKSPNLKIKTVSGEELLLRHGGAMTIAYPICKETYEENGKVKIQITARTEDEAKTMIKGVKRKYSNSNAKEAVGKMITEQNYLDSPLEISLQFGGPLTGRSMVKTALALAAEYGVPTDLCDKSINYLKNSEELPPFGLCYTLDLVINRPLNALISTI